MRRSNVSEGCKIYYIPTTSGAQVLYPGVELEPGSIGLWLLLQTWRDMLREKVG